MLVPIAFGPGVLLLLGFIVGLYVASDRATGWQTGAFRSAMVGCIAFPLGSAALIGASEFDVEAIMSSLVVGGVLLWLQSGVVSETIREVARIHRLKGRESPS